MAAYKIHCYDIFCDDDRNPHSIPFQDIDLITAEDNNTIVGILDDIKCRLEESIKRMSFSEYIEAMPVITFKSIGYRSTERHIILEYNKNNRRHYRKYYIEEVADEES